MKKIMTGLAPLFLTLAVLTGGGPDLPAAESAEVTARHEKMAVSYEKKATVQDALIAEHQKMKKDYKDRYYINEKLTPSSKIRKMEKHCDNIVREAEKLKAELLEFAHWHRMRAAELKGW